MGTTTYRAEDRAPERLVVKWATPTDEALGTARLAGALVDRRIAHASDVAIAVPNRMWAVNLLRACESVGVKASLCIAQNATLDDGGAQGGLETLRGLSLVRQLGWDKRPELAHALLHVQGNEDLLELTALVRGQLERPTAPAHATHIPIVAANALARTFDYLFIVGCVDGLFSDRATFARNVAAGRLRTTASYFAKAPLELAQAARLHFTRRKTEDGQQMAMTQPTPYLSEAGIWRPSTTGGQALLRRYGLN